MKQHIISRCVYDVDGRYVDMDIQTLYNGDAFLIIMSDTSDEEKHNTEIELYLTREELKTVISQLNEVLQK